MAKTTTEKPNTSEKSNTQLIGKALLKKVKELSDKSKKDTAIACGYYTTTKDQQKRVNLGKFYDAVLQAKGVKLYERDTKDGRGRAPTYRACVHKNGQLVIGANYTDEMGLKPGDEFVIQLGHKHIHLRQIISEGESERQNNEEE
ncbi:MAG: AbrB family transcriptional regulator [Trichodesmium sp. St16_bin4-tuft]|nr:AbrB family transcriptional regulator [Trichodesmium sp. MAG_R01]MDE5070154.1 AbrB family transcriptional regulator [Trichodesmium sp. St4_bin8_1]MDE5073010.1 AbrB family transcriptional regulator [Trichodesmium sp. St5_bin8]MDE5076977.1 AbrB family transcriptional regulator [Trichodesmium sp. St2_bin6]MDE5091874.1 AbrB family transcriptional regulator [Trichodesmium sp. St18_bin3_1_1]MDE5097483.1 AbrB family transcriptional regulator [Trichodesmium sp. St16_bin4-tuft]MDE5103629.1 AbrB fam